MRLASNHRYSADVYHTFRAALLLKLQVLDDNYVRYAFNTMLANASLKTLPLVVSILKLAVLFAL